MKGSDATATQIYNLCKNAGWSTEAICGMLGNLSWESSLDPTAGPIAIIIYQMNHDDGQQYFPNANYPEYNLSASEFITSEKSQSFLAQSWLHEYCRSSTLDK
ncbi:MAG: phage tail tip lysozyme [Sarcina sp.]